MSLMNRLRFRVPQYEKHLPHRMMLESPTSAPSYVKKILDISKIKEGNT